MKRIIISTLLLAAFIMTLLISACKAEQKPKSDDFSFSLVWGVYGESSYDSRTGALVKTTNATYPENYVTELFLTDEQLLSVYQLLADMDYTSYPESYDPNDNVKSDPIQTIILTVNNPHKTLISCQNIALGYESENKKGQKFLSAIKQIRDLLIETDEWKALPEYEFFYD